MPVDPPIPSVPVAAEAARYALLRRLAPSMRHHLVVNLQPIGMIYEVMERRLRGPAPDFASVHDSAGKIHGFAKAALQSCVDVVGWLAPDDTAACTVQEAVHECMGMLATSLSFRGYALRDRTESVPGRVRRSSMRHLLTATLIHCTDEGAAPAELLLTTAREPDAALLTIAVQPTAGEPAVQAEANYRKLVWADLEALAQAERMQVVRQPDGTILLRFPWADAA